MKLFKYLLPLLVAGGLCHATTAAQTISSVKIVGASGVVFSFTWSGGKVPVAPAVGSSWTVTTNGANLPVFAPHVPAVSGADYVRSYPYTNFTVSDTGQWLDTNGYKSFTAVVTIATTYGSGCSLYIVTSCTNTGTSLPDNSFHGIQIGSVISASGVYTFDGIGCYTMIYIGANGSSTVSASCIARRP